jgi:tetratricopeptide (TPR) repeat protein
MLLGLGGAQWRCGNVVPARETFLEAAAIARALGDPIPLGWAALGYGTGLGGYARSFRVDETLVALLEESLAAIGTDDSDLRARLLARLAVELYYSPDIERRRALSNEAVAIADRVGDASLLLVTLYCREWSLLGPDIPLDRRLQSTAQIAAMAEELGEREVAYQMQFLRQMALVEAGNIAEADRAVEAAERLAQELRMPSFLPWVLSYRAMRAMLAGRFTEADQLVQEAIQQALAQGADPLLTSMILGGQAMAQQLFRIGFAGILPVLKQMADENPQHPVMRCSLAWLYRELRMTDEAAEIVREMAANDFTGLARDANWLMSIWTLSEAASYVRDLEAAEKLYALLLPFADRWIVASVSICFGPAATPLGGLATVLGRFDEAEQHFARALAETEGLPAPALHAQAARDYAALLIERDAPGDRERAIELLDDVMATTQRYAMPSLELTAKELLATARAQNV